MTHAEFHALIDGYLDETLQEGIKARFLAHLQECRECRRSSCYRALERRRDPAIAKSRPSQ